MQPDTTQWQPHEKDNIGPLFDVWLCVVNSWKEQGICEIHVKQKQLEVMFDVNNLW